MQFNFMTVQTKLLSGFIGILLLAGIAGIMGVKGISEINYQNEIGVIVDELTDYADNAQAASLRFIIYEDKNYHNASVEAAGKVLELAWEADSMMLVEKNRENTAILIALMNDYRDLIYNFEVVEQQKIISQQKRQEVGLEMIRYMDELQIAINEGYSSQAGLQNISSELQRINSDFNDFRSTALNYVLEKTVEGRNEAAEDWLSRLGLLKSRLQLLNISRLNANDKDTFYRVIETLDEYTQQVEIFHSSTNQLWATQYTQRDTAAKVMAQVSVVRDGVQNAIGEATANARTAIRISLIVASLFSVFIAILLSRNITVPLVKGTDVARNIASGKMQEANLDLKRHDELGELAMALDTMSHSLQSRNWLQQGQQGLDDELRGDQNLKELAEKFISFIVKHMETQMGAFYMFDGHDSLTLGASYAFSDRQGNFNKISLGEGIVGQAAIEKEILYFSKVEEDAPGFNYGAGEDVPGHFLVAPLEFKGELIATFMIGSFKPFNKDQKEFISNITNNAAVLFNAAKSRETINTLLANAQQQQEELKKINEELEDQTRALKDSEAELQAQQEELRVTNEELEERTQAIEEQRDSIRVKNEELVQAQEDIEKKASDLEQASRYKSEFLANMSHELRTPLNSILILAQLLSKNGDGNLSEKQIKSATAIHSSGSDLLKLINDILDLSKVEAGKVELSYEHVAMNSIIEDLKRVFEETAKEKGLELNFTKSADVPDSIHTDSHRLQQVLRNLLTNALKFTDKGSVSLTVSCPGSSWRGLKPKEYIAYTIEDTGIGIPKEKQAAIFEAFQQADGSTMRKYGGTGLGLSISRELTKLLGGELTLESEENKGSIFTITLPLKNSIPAAEPESQEKEPAPVKKEAPPEPLRPTEPRNFVNAPEEAEVSDDRNNLGPDDKKILIIEDDPNFVNILADLVREKEFKVLIAGDGETGLHFADYYKPNAILLDVGLPGIDGWTVMERLKDNSQTRHIPVHFISGTDDDLQAMRMGAVGFLTKPVSINDLEGAICKIERFASSHVSTLLVVEDDEVQRESIKELIASDDVEIIDVSSGTEAFEALQGSCYDCMILDLGLKDMSGFDLLEKIHNDPNCATIPIIIYTGRELTKEEESTLNKYAKSIIIKGVRSPERLLDETSLFLHRVESSLPEEQRQMLKGVHNSEAVLTGKKILIVDDDMRNVFALTGILEDKGMEIVVARDGVESIEKLHQEPGVDLVLMDIMMPRMDGYEAMRQIRKEQQFKNLPIISLTAKAMKGDRSKCIEAGASDYLAKPVDTDKLLSMMRVWLYT